MILSVEVEDTDFEDAIRDAVAEIIRANVAAADYAGKVPGYRFEQLWSTFIGLEAEFNAFKLAIQEEMIALRKRLTELEEKKSDIRYEISIDTLHSRC
jgi:hypothetical protein